MSWLSFSPLSVPGGHDNASAGLFVFLGMCTILKSYSSRSVWQWACLQSSFLGTFQYVRFVWLVSMVKGSLVQCYRYLRRVTVNSSRRAKSR